MKPWMTSKNQGKKSTFTHSKSTLSLHDYQYYINLYKHLFFSSQLFLLSIYSTIGFQGYVNCYCAYYVIQ